ncbi:MAG: outer membrane beta-barrel protein [bacterium]
MTLSSVLRFVPIAVLLTSVSAHAQLFNAVGVKGGVNFSASSIQILPDDISSSELETQRRTGWQAALFAEWLKMPVFSVVTQVEYAQRGFTDEQVRTDENGPEPLGTFKLNTQMDYVSVPVLVKLQPSNTGIKPYAIFGPRFDFLVHRETVFQDDGRLDLEFSMADAVNDRAVGGAVGVGVAAKALSLPLLLEVRYNFDFNDNADSEFLTVKSNAVDLWLGITF